MMELLILLFVIVVAVVLVLPILQHYGHREKAQRTNCAGNLKQIGVALLMYSGDFSGHFPPTGKGNSFEPLNTATYLNDSMVYGCPQSTPIKTTASDSSYWYVGGGLRDDNSSASTERLAFDMYGNHKNTWMYAVFIDGHVEGGKPGKELPFHNGDAVIRPKGRW